MEINLRGKVALITGGTRGIGAATAQMLAASGATVAVNYAKNRRNAQDFIRKMQRKKLQMFLLPGDVSDNLVAESIVRQVVDRMGHLDILVNNAGIWEANPIDNPRAEEAWDRTMKVNLKSAFNMCAHAIPHMTKQKGARIINISSRAGQRGEARYSHYAASKGGMIAFTRSLALEVAHAQILVNCVSPGWVWTDMSAPALKKLRQRKQAVKEIPLGKIAQPEDIAGAILFLASPLASYITGEVLNVNGGSYFSG